MLPTFVKNKSTCKHGLGQLGRGLLIRELASRVAPGSSGAELVRPGARSAQLPAKDLSDALHTSNLDRIVILTIIIILMI